jgi:hypothetical protein
LSCTTEKGKDTLFDAINKQQDDVYRRLYEEFNQIICNECRMILRFFLDIVNGQEAQQIIIKLTAYKMYCPGKSAVSFGIHYKLFVEVEKRT